VEPQAVAAAMTAAPEAIEIGEVATVAQLGGRYVEATLEATGRVHP
jgi:hypothetical protein